MFVRVKSTSNSPKRSVQVVESYRNEAGKVRQRIVRHMGTAFSDAEVETLKRFAEYVKEELEAEKVPALFKPQQLADMAREARRRKEEEEALFVDLKGLREENRISVGVPEAFGSVYEGLGFDRLLGARKKASGKMLRHLVMARVANPGSKRKSVMDLSKGFGLELSLDGVYRMMDGLDEGVIGKAGKLALESARKLLGDGISLLFYDCTTLYFESFSEDELKCNGFSKDRMHNQPQVVLGLLVTAEGLPVGYEVFAGNTFEGHTLREVLPRLQESHGVRRVIFTADSAMLSQENLELLEESGMEYIVAARLRSLPESWKKKVTQREESWDEGAFQGYEKIRSFDYGKGRRLIVTWSGKLARKNKHDRDTAIGKLRAKLGKSRNVSSMMSNHGYKRFLKITGKAELKLDEERYAEAEKFDGLHGVITNAKDLSDRQVVTHYHELWQIEDCFRISKHDLKIRPIYHWTPRRVRAHLLICFLALVCVRHLSYYVRLRFENMSAGRMINALNHIQLSILRDRKDDRRYLLPSAFNEDARKIYKTLNLPVSTIPCRLD